MIPASGEVFTIFIKYMFHFFQLITIFMLFLALFIEMVGAGGACRDMGRGGMGWGRGGGGSHSGQSPVQLLG